MRGAWILGTAVLLVSVAVLPAMAQITVTSVDPLILGQSIARAAVRLNVAAGSISDGLTITFANDEYDVAHQGTWAYEFNTSGGLNDAGAVEVVPPTSGTTDAFIALKNVINSDPNAPVDAVFYTDLGWFVTVWKWKNEWGLGTTGPRVAESGDTSGVVTVTSSGRFSTLNQDTGAVYLQLKGTGLTGLSDTNSVKLRHQVNTSELYSGRVIQIKNANSASISFNTLNVGSGTPPTIFPSLGDYELEIDGTPTGHIVTLVENLLDDPTFRVHATGAGLATFWFSTDNYPGAHWMADPYTDMLEYRDNGSQNRQICPRLYPFPTGATKHGGNDTETIRRAVDDENGSLQWSADDGVHRFWQTIGVDFQADTTLKLTGVWAAAGDHYAMSYGAQLRAGDEDGTIIAETPPGQRVVTPFSWTDLSVSGVFPSGTTQVTVVFYGDSPTTDEASLHVDNLLLRVDDDHPTPPGITGMTTPNDASIGDTNATITLTGVNLTNGQTSVTLREPDVMVEDYLSWADVGRKLVAGGAGQAEFDRAPFGAYEFAAGDTFVVTSGPNIVLGAYEIAGKDDDRVITLVDDINGVSGDEAAQITGYIVKAPLAAGSVNATGTQVTAEFDLTGVPAGYRSIIVEVGAHDPIVWREGFNVIHAGSTLINGSFELPTAPSTDCMGSRGELPFSPASDWKLRFWNGYDEQISPILNFRDDWWNAPGDGFNLPSCPPAERGEHYLSSAIYNFEGTAQWYQTIHTQPGQTYTLSGHFAHSAEFGVHLTEITLSLLDGDSAAAPMAGASAVVLSGTTFEDWTFGSVTGTATGDIMTIAFEVENQGPSPNGPRAVWIDDLVLTLDLCNDPFADADGDGDVDQDDFANFQLCATGVGGGVPTDPANCYCFDTEGAGGMPDDDIDAADFTNFQACASGPTVPANAACDD